MIGYKVKHKNPTIHGLINARPVRRLRLSAFDLLLVFSCSYLTPLCVTPLTHQIQYYPLIPENEIPSIKYF